MKIERATIYHIAMELVTPFETSFGVETARHCVLLRLQAEGLEGWGECVATLTPGYSYETVGTAWHILRSYFLPALLGQEIREIPDLIPLLDPFKGHPMARAGLEMALWDLLGKARGQSLSEMLGGQASRVPVGVSVGLHDSMDSLLPVLHGYQEAGYARIKLKIKPGMDVDYVGNVREAFPELPLQVDANSAYGLDAVPIFKAMDSMDLILIEQPLAEDDLIDHSHLQAELSTPICLDESIASVRHTRQALAIDACRVVNIKPGRVGGLWEAKRIHDLCVSQNVPVWCGGMLETNVGRASNLALAALPGFSLPGDISASDRYYAQDLAGPNFELNPDSTITVPQGPGLGIEIWHDPLERFCERQETLSG